MKSRGRDEITASILQACNNGPLTMSRIMYYTMSNFNQVKEYSFMLAGQGFLLMQPQNRTFIITDKGKKYLKLYNELKAVAPSAISSMSLEKRDRSANLLKGDLV
jgi:predicted transcriptional regulator